MNHFGRVKILRDETEITPENVAKILSETFTVHQQNMADIDYLYRVYRGDQDILTRTKEVRQDICNKIVENRSYELVQFFTGFVFGEPIQYVSRGASEESTDGIKSLNDMMLLCDKDAIDNEIAEWEYICGQAYRMTRPNKEEIDYNVVPKIKKRNADLTGDESPFSMYVLDPRFTYVVYHSGLGERPLMNVKYVVKQDKSVIFSAYTNDSYYEVTGNTLGNISDGVTRTPRSLDELPIVEYPLNNARLGLVEVVLPITNAMNTVASNRADGIEQFIQSLLVFYNCDIDESAAKVLREAGVIKLKSVGDNKADIKEITAELNQMQTQTLINYMYQTMLDIVGAPNRNGGSSTSDTGAAVVMRDGWQSAEARAKRDETAFKRAERQTLKIALKIMRATIGTKLKLSDIEIKFTRRNYADILSKAQVLVTMLGCEKIAPILAFIHCGMFSDPEDAAKQSAEHYATVKAEADAKAELEFKRTQQANASKPKAEGGDLSA